MKRIVTNRIFSSKATKYYGILFMSIYSFYDYNKQSSITLCDEIKNNNIINLVNNNTNINNKKNNDDIFESSLLVEEYVDKLLSDPRFNIIGVPDEMERRIYTFTIKLTINSILHWVSYLNNIELFKHKFKLCLKRGFKSPELPSSPIDREALNSFVSTLLEDQRINIAWLPDIIERQLYLNCLVLIFTVFQSFIETTNIHIIGHTLKISLLPSSNELNKELANKTSDAVSRINESVLDDIIDDILLKKSNSFIPNKFEKSILKTLYAIILCMCEKISSDFQMNLIGDSVLVKLEPIQEYNNQVLNNNNNINNKNELKSHIMKLNEILIETDDEINYLKLKLEKYENKRKLIKKEIYLSNNNNNNNNNNNMNTYFNSNTVLSGIGLAFLVSVIINSRR